MDGDAGPTDRGSSDVGWSDVGSTEAGSTDVSEAGASTVDARTSDAEAPNAKGTAGGADGAAVDVVIDRRRSRLLLASILIVALCGIVYELIIGAIASYLLGNSVLQFSLTVGVFMFAMGIGSLLSRYLGDDHVRQFVWVEIAIALVGGVSGIALFVAFPFARVLFEFVMYGFILVIGILVGLEIPILTTILAKGRSTRESISEVLTLDYVGALLGSVLFPLVLLPTLGPIRSSFAIGLMNIAVATISVVAFRALLGRSYRYMLVLSIATAVTLCVALGYGTRLGSFAEKHLYFDSVVFDERTPYQHLVVTRSVTTGDTRLFIDGHIQFSSRDEYRYHEYLVHPAMAVEGPRANVLVLGGGDGLAARELLKYPDVERIDLVDIDPEMTRIHSELPMLRAVNEDSLRSPRVHVFHEDAFTYVNRAGRLYDRVIVDFPDPHDAAIGKLYSREFYTMVKRRTNPGAVVTTQSSSPFYTRRVFWSIEATLGTVFDSVASYHTALPSFGIWGFNIARHGAPLPELYPIRVPTRAIDDASMLAAMVFEADTGPLEDSPVNSIMQPLLYKLYLDDMRR